MSGRRLHVVVALVGVLILVAVVDMHLVLVNAALAILGTVGVDRALLVDWGHQEVAALIECVFFVVRHVGARCRRG